MTVDWREWYRMFLAQLELLKARRLLRTRPVGSLVTVLKEDAEPSADADLSRAIGWAVAVDRAARYGVFRPTCLIRSLALVRLLDRSGIRGGRIRAGVLRKEGQFLAHAWVELGPVVLSDPPSYVAQFEPWADMRMFEDLAG